MKTSVQKLTLGIYSSGMPSSAAIIGDGKIIAACMEDRLSRVYRDRDFPHQAVKYCLDEANARMEDVETIAYGWNPGLNVSARGRGGFSARPPTPMAWLYSIPNQILPGYVQGDCLETIQEFKMDGGRSVRFHYVYHYLAHAANAYYLSPFEDCAVFCADAYGEVDSTTWILVEKGKFKVLRRKAFPQSLGNFYSAITEFIGFAPYRDEWKMMGLAAYGDPSIYKNQILKLVRETKDGSYELDLKYFNFYNFETKGFFSSPLVDLLGEPRLPGQELGKKHADIAAAAQLVLEEILYHCLADFHKNYPTDNLCLTGGVFMNSLFNGKAGQNTPYKNIYISHSPDDSGTSLGAALYAHGAEHPFDRQKTDPGNPFLGPEWSDEEIRQKLADYGVSHKQMDDVTGETAGLLAQGRIVGWYQGRLEFGQRALGNRSILANPCQADMKDRINRAVKFREPFRPFAPAILEEEAGRYFKWDGGECRFMERVVPVKSEMRGVIPAVTHEDGTGRLQVVKRDWNPLFYDLIKAFGGITGVPVILNTSFNLNGEPIVNSPEDAIQTFFCSGMDVLVLGNYLIEK